MTLFGAEPGRRMIRDTRRRRVVRAAVSALVVLAATIAARRASAYCRTTTCPQCDYDDKGCPSGLPIVWPTSCLTFAMQYRASKQIDLPTAIGVMEKAFSVWQDVTCTDSGGPPAMRVDHHFGDASCTLHEYNQTDANANIIMFRDALWPYEGAANVLGLTTITYSRKTGFVFDADMEINSTQRLSVADPVPAASYDLQSIVTHEAGHFIGMAHSTELTATMYPTYTAGTESFRMLAQDDVDGICAVYPRSSAAQCDFAPRQGFSPECGIFPSGQGGQCSLTSGELAGRGTDGFRWVGLASVLAAVGFARRRGRRSQADGR